MKTYDEICHALKCCWIHGKCTTCPYYDDDSDIMECTSNLAREALILIESLKRDNDRLLKSLNLTQQEQYTNGRTDGIREFAERLKNKFYSYYEGLDENTSKSKYNGETLMYYEVADMIENCIDNTVEEMTEESNG